MLTFGGSRRFSFPAFPQPDPRPIAVFAYEDDARSLQGSRYHLHGRRFGGSLPCLDIAHGYHGEADTDCELGLAQADQRSRGTNLGRGNHDGAEVALAFARRLF
jgi:hypothetical protein